MLATESADDSEKMTGLWRKKVPGVKKEEGREGRGRGAEVKMRRVKG